MGYMYLFELVFCISLDKYLEVELVAHMVVLFLIFWGTSELFSTVAAPIYSPPSSAPGFSFLHILALIVCWFIYDNHSDKCEVTTHDGFNLHFCDN